jgi:hypothetical protein
VRLTLQRDYQQNFKKNILPSMGDMELNAVTTDTLESFRIHLVDERDLALKTARNIIDGSLRAMIRDAGRRIERNPFNDLPNNWWPRLPRASPIRTASRNEMQFSLTTGTIARIGPMRLFFSGSGQERGQVKRSR